MPTPIHTEIDCAHWTEPDVSGDVQWARLLESTESVLQPADSINQPSIIDGGMAA